MEALEVEFRKQMGELFLDPAQLKVGDPIGRGAFGLVRAGQFGEISVAVKEVPVSSGDLFMADMCSSEARIMAALHHEYIARFYGVSMGHFTVQIVMELLEANLSSRLAQLATMSIQKRLQIASQIIAGLSYLHEQSVVHRDLNPNNILFDVNDNVRICDFGLARPILSTHVSLSNVGGGTPNYMPYEQFCDSQLSYSSDIYAFGAVLYFLFTGIPPYAGLKPLQLMREVEKADVLQVPDTIPANVRLLIEACTRRDPAARLTAAEAAEWVGKTLRGESLGASAELLVMKQQISSQALQLQLQNAKIDAQAALIEALRVRLQGLEQTVAFQSHHTQRKDPPTALREITVYQQRSGIEYVIECLQMFPGDAVVCYEALFALHRILLIPGEMAQQNIHIFGELDGLLHLFAAASQIKSSAFKSLADTSGVSISGFVGQLPFHQAVWNVALVCSTVYVQNDSLRLFTPQALERGIFLAVEPEQKHQLSISWFNLCAKLYPRWIALFQRGLFWPVYSSAANSLASLFGCVRDELAQLDGQAIDLDVELLNSFGIVSSPQLKQQFDWALLQGFEIPLLVLIKAGFPLSGLRQAGYDATSLLSIGIQVRSLVSAGYAVTDLRNAGIDATTLKNIGLDATALVQGGFDPATLKSAGFQAGELKVAGCTMGDLIPAGYCSADLLPVFDLKSLRAENLDLKTLVFAGFDAAMLKEAGYNASELKHAGFDASVLQAVGFTVKQLKSAGFDARSLRAAGFNAKPLKLVGYDASALKAAGFDLRVLKSAGFDTASLLQAGFTDAEVGTIGFMSCPVGLSCSNLNTSHRNLFSHPSLPVDGSHVAVLTPRKERPILAVNTAATPFDDLFSPKLWESSKKT